MQGFNMGKYIPPAALDAGLASANAAAGKRHALGKRASKLSSHGILTVRFEMPFAIWCSACPKPTIIAQGVRFNAEKRRVGSYHSTPIWAFRMKHTACGGWIEVRTDPANAEYLVHEGGRRRDHGEDERDDAGNRITAIGSILTEEERARRRRDAFAAFEGKQIEDQQKEGDGRRIEEVYLERDQYWDDPGSSNRKARRLFRQGRRLQQQRDSEKELVQDRMSLGIELLDETEDDARRARLTTFGPRQDSDFEGLAMVSVPTRPMFVGHPHGASEETRMGGSALPVGNSKQGRGQSINDVMDPFNPASSSTRPTKHHIVGSLRRKQSAKRGDRDDVPGSPHHLGVPFEKKPLVDYDTD